jgi:hypothetical protein
VIKVSGLDLAMGDTGACHTLDDGAPCWHLIRPKKAGDRRLGEIKTNVMEFVEGSELVLLEMLPPNMMGAGITGMVQGVIRDELQAEGIHYGDIGPSALKKYATGRGTASKTEMALAALKRGGHEFTDHNLCDGWWAWVMANDYLGQPVFPLPAANREMLRKIEMKG